VFVSSLVLTLKHERFDLVIVEVDWRISGVFVAEIWRSERAECVPTDSHSLFSQLLGSCSMCQYWV